MASSSDQGLAERITAALKCEDILNSRDGEYPAPLTTECIAKLVKCPVRNAAQVLHSSDRFKDIAKIASDEALWVATASSPGWHYPLDEIKLLTASSSKDKLLGGPSDCLIWDMGVWAYIGDRMFLPECAKVRTIGLDLVGTRKQQLEKLARVLPEQGEVCGLVVEPSTMRNPLVGLLVAHFWLKKMPVRTYEVGLTSAGADSSNDQRLARLITAVLKCEDVLGNQYVAAPLTADRIAERVGCPVKDANRVLYSSDRFRDIAEEGTDEAQWIATGNPEWHYPVDEAELLGSPPSAGSWGDGVWAYIGSEPHYFPDDAKWHKIDLSRMVGPREKQLEELAKALPAPGDVDGLAVAQSSMRSPVVGLIVAHFWLLKLPVRVAGW